MGQHGLGILSRAARPFGAKLLFHKMVGGNLGSLQAMARANDNPQAHFLAVQGANHFSVLAPICALLAEKILQDDPAAGPLAIGEKELNEAFAKTRQ